MHQPAHAAVAAIWCNPTLNLLLHVCEFCMHASVCMCERSPGDVAGWTSLVPCIAERVEHNVSVVDVMYQWTHKGLWATVEQVCHMAGPDS